MTLQNASFVAAIQERPLLELCQVQGPLASALLASPLTVAHGVLALPDGMGVGIELAALLEERFPYIEGHYGLLVDRGEPHL